MKKVLSVLFILLFIFFPIVTKAVVTSSSYTNIKVYMFYDDECKSCDKAKSWLDEKIKDNNRVKKEYIKITDNEKINQKVKDVLNIKGDKLPLILIGSNYFKGFNNTIKNNVTEAIKAYEEAESYCELVSKVRSDKDLGECVKENEGIYNQPSQIATFIKVILIIVGIGLIIGIVLIIWKKKGNKLNIKLKNK